jgi:hypothetical protein
MQHVFRLERSSRLRRREESGAGGFQRRQDSVRSRLNRRQDRSVPRPEDCRRTPGFRRVRSDALKPSGGFEVAQRSPGYRCSMDGMKEVRT